MKQVDASQETVIALLIVNRIRDLPLLAVNSIRRQNDSRIYVGYLNESDIQDLRALDNLIFINLSEFLQPEDQILLSASTYAEYTSEIFFRLVRLKWSLFSKVCKEVQNGIIIYSDLDVLWLDDVVGYIEHIFQQNSKIQICIQDQTFMSLDKVLCMGLFSVRVNMDSIDFFEEMSIRHKDALAINPKAGDDGVITDYYRALEDKSIFFLLPQMGFPVGSLSNAFFDVGYFTGLKLTKPYIFHANYVVGQRRKLVLLLAVARHFGLDSNLIKFNATIGMELALRKYFLRLIHIFKA